jgi:hypothetical protein
MQIIYIREQVQTNTFLLIYFIFQFVISYFLKEKERERKRKKEKERERKRKKEKERERKRKKETERDVVLLGTNQE